MGVRLRAPLRWRGFIQSATREAVLEDALPPSALILSHRSEPVVSLPPTMDSSNRIAVIRNILNQYPLSIGIFREIIQNSEDARASKQVESPRHTFGSNHSNRCPQIFLLDSRIHPPAQLSGKSLEHTNGPALLAFNDASFRPEDWKGILATFGSSKRADAS